MLDPKQLKLSMRVRGSGDIAVPALLTGKALASPTLSYGATFGNYAGGLVNRIDGRAGRGRSADAAGASAIEAASPSLK